MTWMVDLGNYVAVLLTISIYTVLYKDNLLYRFAQFTTIGMGAAHATVMGITYIRQNTINPILYQNHWSLVIPIILGILLFCRPAKKYVYLSNYGAAVVVGVGTGLGVRARFHMDFVNLIKATILPVTTSNPLTNFNNFVIILSVITVVSFFIFTQKSMSQGPPRYLSKIGMYFIMMALGCMFANTALGRLSMLTGRIQFVLEVLGIIS